MIPLPSRRFLALAALGLVPAGLAAVIPGFFTVVALYLAGCGILFAAEYFLGVRPEAIEARRRLPARLSLNEAEEVTLELRNFSRWPVRLELRDTPPAGWESVGDSPDPLPTPTPLESQPSRSKRKSRNGGPSAGPTFLAMTLGPQESGTLAYEVTPPARGRFAFGDLVLRVTHFPGLVVRQVAVPLAQEVRVYPDLREVERYELMARRSRLQEFGIHRARAAGRGTEVEQLREYTRDDEYRQIDWKATARRRKPISRVYEVERSQNVLLVLDAGRMMAGQVGRLTKFDYAVNAALILGHVALRSGDRIGLMVVSDGVDAYLPLGKGRAQFKTCTDLLYSVQPKLCHVDYRGALEQIAVRCKRRSLVVFFTDLVDEETSAELVTYLRLLRPVHLPLCVTLQDVGVVQRAARVPAAVKEMYERAVAVELLDERRRVLDRLQKQGAAVLDCPPGELSVAVVNRYLELKSRQLL